MKKNQKKGSSIVRQIDTKYNIERDPQLCLAQLMEEIGELARAVNTPRLRGKKLDRDNLNEEFADVLLLLFTLAEMHDVDLQQVLVDKMEILKQKHGLEKTKK